VAILAAKKSIDHLQSITDDLFLFSSLGFLIVLVMGYLAHKDSPRAQAGALTAAAELVFSASLLAIERVLRGKRERQVVFDRRR
jgi:hypothetical protein